MRGDEIFGASLRPRADSTLSETSAGGGSKRRKASQPVPNGDSGSKASKKKGARTGKPSLNVQVDSKVVYDSDIEDVTKGVPLTTTLLLQVPLPQDSIRGRTRTRTLALILTLTLIFPSLTHRCCSFVFFAAN